MFPALFGLITKKGDNFNLVLLKVDVTIKCKNMSKFGIGLKRSKVNRTTACTFSHIQPNAEILMASFRKLVCNRCSLLHSCCCCCSQSFCLCSLTCYCADVRPVCISTQTRSRNLLPDQMQNQCAQVPDGVFWSVKNVMHVTPVVCCACYLLITCRPLDLTCHWWTRDTSIVLAKQKQKSKAYFENMCLTFVLVSGVFPLYCFICCTLYSLRFCFSPLMMLTKWRFLLITFQVI